MSQQHKPILQEFVEANMALIECYNKVSVDEYKKMSASAQGGLCATHKNKVKAILESNQMTMSRLLQDRIAILHRLGAENEHRSMNK